MAIVNLMRRLYRRYWRTYGKLGSRMSSSRRVRYGRKLGNTWRRGNAGVNLMARRIQRAWRSYKRASPFPRVLPPNTILFRRGTVPQRVYRAPQRHLPLRS